MNLDSRALSGLFAERYQIERTLGHGASATVYLATDSKQDRPIALKVLDHELAHAIGAKRFMQEIHITARLQHPHILPIHDSGEWQGLLYYVLPYVAGESLRARLDREKQLPVDECVRLTCDIATALSYSHAKGVIHRDVKPENILLSDGHALIADFGIARSTEVITGERLTSSGLIVGTSQYMSPEQASGERDIDARSDIYSLGCVLYEMLAGVEPFVGANVQAIIAQRFTHAPRPVTTFRPTVPQNLEAALDKALAISPADRFQTMKEFAEALPPGAPNPPDRRKPGRKARDFLRTTRGKITLAGSLLALLVAAMFASPRALSTMASLVNSAPVDPESYVVLPPTEWTPQATQSAEDVADHLNQAFQSWNDVHLVPDLKVEEAVKNAGPPASLTEALDIARGLGAAKLVWGRKNRLQLYDVSSSSRLNEVAFSSVDSTTARTALLKLLSDRERPWTAEGGDLLTRSFVAWKAYGLGHAALKRWKLTEALQEFEKAARLDPGYVPARLWNGQLKSWTNPDSADAWLGDAAFAASRASLLSPRDRLVAEGLGALGTKDYPAACTAYRKLTVMDSLDFLGWYGLGECGKRDEQVIRARSRLSPSGWEFRSSSRQAAANYMHAVRLDPRAHSIISFQGMQKLLPIYPSSARGGRDSTGTTAFAAYPSIMNDTLAFTPYPLATFASLPRTALGSRNEALDRNARDLFEFTMSWTRADPGNANAFEALATTLEARGEVGPRAANGISASEAVAKARKLSGNRVQQVRLASAEVRLRVKRSQFGAANELADSILTHSTDPVFDPERMSLAALTGRVAVLTAVAGRNQSWLPIASGRLTIQPALVITAAEIFARALVGDCGPQANALEEKISSQIESFVTPEKRSATKHALLSRSLSMRTPCTRGKSALGIPLAESRLYRLQRAFANGDMAATRSLLDSMTTARALMRPADLSPDFTFHEAWVRAAAGDTAGAIKEIDLALESLPSLGANMMRDPAAAASLGRMMVLRADIASSRGDRRTALRWAGAASELWRGADSELAPAISRMQAIARKR